MWSLLLTVAQGSTPVGVFTGLHQSGPEHELYDSSSHAHQPIGSSALLGIRGALHLGPVGFVEGEGMLGANLSAGGLLHGIRGHVGVRIPLDSPFTPFLVVGGGTLGVSSVDLGNDTDLAMHAGPGVTLDLSPTLQLRGDLRWMGSGRQGPGGVGHHTEALIGLQLRPRAKAPDADGDGVPDEQDQCPNDGELRNGFEDADGCPDDLAQVHLKVKNAEGDLVRNATVHADGQPVGNSNRDGRLTLPDRMPGTSVTLQPFQDGLEASPIEVTLQEGDNRVDLELGWAPGTLLVTAKNLGGTPISAEVWANGPGAEHWALDGTGRSQSVLEPGRWRIMLASEGYDAIIKLVELPDTVGPRTHIDAILRPQRIQLRNDEIVTLDPILFERGSSRVDAVSLSIIEAVAAVLVNHPEILQIEVAGHASAEGSNISNQELSQQRVDRVKRMLIDRGVAAERVVAVGYGESQPTADNTTAAGRKRNRRVEFHVLQTQTP